MSQLPVSRPPLSRPALSFTDSRYLLHVIGRLNRERLKQGLSLEAVARRARLKRKVIDRAERRGQVPTSKDFKAWSSALGLTWDQVWSDYLPGVAGSPMEQRT